MGGASGRPTVLIVEDLRSFRQMYRTILTAGGFDVLEAEDGAQGWQLAQEHRPDLVLLDLVLPKLGGIEVMTRIRADEALRETPIIVLSSAGTPQDIQRGLEAGADDYTVKGLYAPKQLLSKIRTTLASRRVREASAPYRLTVAEGRADAAKLQQDIGLGGPFRCVPCGESLVLELLSDPTRTPGHWFAARFVCPKCGRIC